MAGRISRSPLQMDRFRPPRGHGYPVGGETAPAVEWSGDLDDDYSAVIGPMYAHAEHLNGPAQGGIWYCHVSDDDEIRFHSLDLAIEPRNGEAARWLCELVFLALEAGVAL